MDIKIELIILPVTDVDRAKAFYVDQVGFHADFDQRVNENLRFVQLTPAGSACSIAFGEGLTDAAPGSVKGLQAVVADADEAHAELTGKAFRSPTSTTGVGPLRSFRRPGRERLDAAADARAVGPRFPAVRPGRAE